MIQRWSRVSGTVYTYGRKHCLSMTWDPDSIFHLQNHICSFMCRHMWLKYCQLWRKQINTQKILYPTFRFALCVYYDITFHHHGISSIAKGHVRFPNTISIHISGRAESIGHCMLVYIGSRHRIYDTKPYNGHLSFHCQSIRDFCSHIWRHYRQDIILIRRCRFIKIRLSSDFPGDWSLICRMTQTCNSDGIWNQWLILRTQFPWISVFDLSLCMWWCCAHVSLGKVPLSKRTLHMFWYFHKVLVIVWSHVDGLLSLSFIHVLCREQPRQMQLAKQMRLTPTGHLVSPLESRGWWMTTVISCYVTATLLFCC